MASLLPVIEYPLGTRTMRCDWCKREGESKKLFKRREFYQLGCHYYVCKTCGRANRPNVQEINPRQRHLRRALETGRNIRARYLKSSADIKFKVLVWGPGPANIPKKPVYEKREQIRDTLGQSNDEAYFSEEIRDILDEHNQPLPIDLAELLQVDYFDLVIDIADSPGSLEEAERFARLLGSRFLLWLRKGSERGFVSGLANSLTGAGNPPFFFEDEDIKSCVMTLASTDWVKGRRMAELGYQIEGHLLERVSILGRKRIQ